MISIDSSERHVRRRHGRLFGVSLLATLLAAALLAPIALAAGELDTSFGSGGRVTTDFLAGEDYANDVAVQADGKLVAAGWSSASGNQDFGLARYRKDGSLDPTFGSGGKVRTPIGGLGDGAHALAIQADGKIVAVGGTDRGGQSNVGLVRYNGDGSLDTTFDGDGKISLQVAVSADARAVAIQPDGKIVIAGVAFSFATRSDFLFARFNVNGVLDSTFGSGGIVTLPVAVGQSHDLAFDVALQADGKIVGSGMAQDAAGFEDFAVVRVNANGSLDSTFDGDGKAVTPLDGPGATRDEARGLVIQPDGRIVVAGCRNCRSSFTDFALVRYESSGALDTSFGSGGKVTTDFAMYDDDAHDIALESDGKLVVGGFTYAAFGYSFALARYDSAGSLDPTFGDGGRVVTAPASANDRALGMKLDGDGRIVLAGCRNCSSTTSDFALARYLDGNSADTTAPAITFAVDGALGHNGWYRSDVTLQWTVTENESPSSLQKNGCVDQTLTADQGPTTYSCSATSDGGSAGPFEVTIKRDASAPSVECGTIPSGWQAANVILSCSSSDVTSGLASLGDASFELFTNVAEGEETVVATTAARTVADLAGNEVTVGPFSFSVDRKAPSVSLRPAGDSCTLPGVDGWCRGVQSAGFSATDGGSGLASDGAASREFARQNASEGAAVMIASGTVEDLVGNANAGVSAGPYKIDSIAPTVVCPSPAPVFILGEAGATVTTSVSDAVSGPVAMSVSAAAETSSVGSKSVALTGFDVAGNSTQTSCGYSVTYDWSGFFSPVDNPNVWNVAKAGSAIPVKFSLAGDQGLGILAAGSPSSIQVACPSNSLTDTVEETVTASTSGLTYDADADQYVYVWKTGSWTGTCRQLNVKLVDGTVHSALFKFVK